MKGARNQLFTCHQAQLVSRPAVVLMVGQASQQRDEHFPKSAKGNVSQLLITVLRECA